MGDYYKIVNPDNREYIDPDLYGVSCKRSGYMGSPYGTVVALLVCKPEEVGRVLGPLAGSWYGHRVIAAGDGCGHPDQHGFATATVDRPGRNLNELAETEYENISLKTFGLLALAFEDYAAAFAESAKPGSVELINLGNAILLYETTTAFASGCQVLRHALAARLGESWIESYRQACRDNPPFNPFYPSIPF